jgi:hypothetical protein
LPAPRKPSSLDTYRSHLCQLREWDGYLRQESRLPGPRANLELLEAVIEVGDRARFAHLLALDGAFPYGAPSNTPDEVLTVCAVAGLGKLVAQGDRTWLAELRRRASDNRWRVREAVAIALQHWGDADLPALVAELRGWSGGSWLEKRAVVAALAEPRLLLPADGHVATEDPAAAVLLLFDAVTKAAASASAAERRTSGYQVLRQALGYGWSVLVAARPAISWLTFERWLAAAATTCDKDLIWIARQNLKKSRLLALDRDWASGWLAKLE